MLLTFKGFLFSDSALSAAEPGVEPEVSLLCKLIQTDRQRTVCHKICLLLLNPVHHLQAV